MAFDVHVVDQVGKGVDGARVVLGFKTSVRGRTGPEYTGSDGHAEFDGYDDGEVEVFVDGADYGTYDYKDGEGITITK
jgi:hypothetical protein